MIAQRIVHAMLIDILFLQGSAMALNHRYSVVCLLFMCSALGEYAIIPKPKHLVPGNGEFSLQQTTNILLQPYNEATCELASYITEVLWDAVGIRAEIGALQAYNGTDNNINIIIDEQSGIAHEGYRLSITPEQLTMHASSVTGAFWAFQTVRQLMPQIPCVTIEDEPRFAYRGLMLDVARHMFSVEYLKKFIDVMAAYKYNVFHWHLTDDQGWRIEIKAYPRLQEVAAYRDETLIGHKKTMPHVFDGVRYGGYYTQEEIKEVVAYAAQRHITIIPEIDLPGHCTAVLAAYPELGCTHGPYKVSPIWGIHEEVFCVGNEQTFQFLQNVLTEVMQLFPSRYIHIGGDEVRKTRWQQCSLCQARKEQEHLESDEQLQMYFTQRIARFLQAHERTIIGWDEILDKNLPKDAVIMSWRGTQGGVEAAQMGHPAIMTPFEYVYFDYYQSHDTGESLAIGGYLPLEKVYQYDPMPEDLTLEQSSYIQGAQANIWTEYISTPEHVDYMTYPRALALAEVVWAQADHKDYADFITRLHGNKVYLDSMGINPSHHGYKNNETVLIDGTEQPRFAELVE
jgi:hexosaminidase